MDNEELKKWVEEELELNNDFKSELNNNRLHQIISCIDLTTLNATDSEESVTQFVRDGIDLTRKPNVPDVAAICVFSNFTTCVVNELKGLNISTAVVAAAFPHGQANLATKTMEVDEAAKSGADDIDIVINRGLVLQGKYKEVADEISSFKNASGNAHLKVILEVSESNLAQIFKVSIDAINAGADFLKTSTGKGSSGASLEASLVMCKAIQMHFETTGKRVGFKAAGGISTSSVANQYFNLMRTMLGESWTTKKYFRIGASSLLKNIITDIK